jgi:hypothetical protein
MDIRKLLEPTDVHHQMAELRQIFLCLSLKRTNISTTMNTQTIALIRFESFSAAARLLLCR